MDAHTNFVGAAGQDFDEWLDYSGTTDETSPPFIASTTTADAKPTFTRPMYPISPTSPSANALYLSAPKSALFTAPLTSGPLTPSQSSGSPEAYSASSIRLSGDTLRDDISIGRQKSLKRKLSSTDTPDTEQPSSGPRLSGSKRPHNVIEKRYRANLNEKIAELRDSVPVLRASHKARSKEDGNNSSGAEDADGLAPSNKLNKASILTKAVEYIRHLEFRNKRLEDENSALKERLQTLDRVIAKGGNDAERATAFTSDNVIEQATQNIIETSPKQQNVSASKSAQGVIPVPDTFKRMRQSQPQEHYGSVYQNTPGGSRLGGKWPTRIMIGSLAGLMIMEGFSESDVGTDSREKGLFGIPLELLDGWTFLRSPKIYLSTFAEYCHAGGIIPLVKGFLALSVTAFFIFAYLFNSRPHSEDDYEKQAVKEPQSATPASPIEVRRRAWSTSMQALHLPHHHFFPEWLAITQEWLRYSLRALAGPQAYTWLTGRSTDDEVARVKAWDIAIDAQLAGGDVEVSRSRLVLTIFGSGTLPQTPMRLMQKALHLRVLLWNVGVTDTTTSRAANYVATLLANHQWRSARRLHERLSSRDADRLPGYLNYLLQMDCDDVFNDTVTQRATNLMYNRPTSEHAEDGLMDVVVEDHAIRSPLDAIAAWRSTCALHDALDAALQSPDSPDRLREHIQAALEIAPPGSTAETRAMAVHAVLSPGRREAFYSKASEAMKAELPVGSADVSDMLVPFFIDSSTPLSARPEVASCLNCAKVMLILDQEQDFKKALDLFSVASASLPSTVLSGTCSFFVLWRLWRCSGSGSSGPTELTQIATELYGHFQKSSGKIGLEANKLDFAVAFLRNVWEIESQVRPSVSPSRRHSTVSNDTGYGSLSDEEEQQYLQKLSGCQSAGSSERLVMTRCA